MCEHLRQKDRNGTTLWKAKAPSGQFGWVVAYRQPENLSGYQQGEMQKYSAAFHPVLFFL